MRVKTARDNHYYPDIVVVCGERKFEDGKRDVLLNPAAIVEVLSKSTKLKDRNEKLDSYMALESLTDYVLVDQDAMRIEHFSKLDDEHWKMRLLSEPSQKLVLESANCSVTLADIYNEIEFETVPKKRGKSKNN